MPKVQQNGSGGGGRRGRGAHVASSLAEINVVPLVDVMLVLLIIFMVTAPMMQQGLEVNLPQAAQANPVEAQPVYVTVPADFATRRGRPDRQERSEDRDPPRARAAGDADADRQVGVHPRRRPSSVQDLMTVTRKLNEAGVDKVGLLSQPEVRR